MRPVVRHPLFARVYARLSVLMEHRGMAEHRRRLLEGVRGRVVEVGAGNGLTFAYYPPEVTQVVAVEPEPYLRGRARRQAERAGVPVEVVDGVAEELPVDDAAFDAAVVSLVLCSVTAPDAAVAELHRVLRPGGQLRFLEHVRAATRGLRGLQRALDATVWPHVAGNCHTGRDTVRVISAGGFEIERLDRFRFPSGRLSVPTSPHVLATGHH